MRELKSDGELSGTRQPKNMKNPSYYGSHQRSTARRPTAEHESSLSVKKFPIKLCF